ncbi:MAG TPA: 3-hydroxyacyl-CoA dehydrogenase NAD-binding domain-containing protein [Bdellovibrionota bacterium]|nr:3-hydroxyacyl-CoA dehydrogenase NAD-binding domain-containing protein [Bdellovibrionota bacterium]
MAGANHQLEFRKDGIAELSLDTQGRSANILSSEMVDELTRTFQRLHAMKEVTGLLIRSAKPKTFIAGADVNEIFAVQDANYAIQKSRQGHALMNLVETLPYPSVAAIDGPCLGGGMEFALACTYRICGNGSNVRLGLPEVRFGIIPGFGGTQRLPKTIGFLPSVDMIVSGRIVDSRRALRIGLVDDVVPSEILDNIARDWLKRGARRRSSKKTPLWHRLVEWLPPARHYVLKKVREKTLAATSGFYPAPLAAIDVLEETFRAKKADGYEVEARRVGELAASPVSKSLIHIFLATEEIRRSKLEIAPKPVRKVGIIGAGVMGGGIAHIIAAKGKMIRLRDIAPSAIAKALDTVRELNEKEVAKKRIDRREAENRYIRIAPTTDWTGFHRADLVIEAVVENLDIKKQVFAELAKHVRNDTVLASNTSALSISEIAASVPHPARVIGLHFFNPVHRMQLVEIVKGRETGAPALSTTLDFALSMGKTPIVVADRPGFLVNRLLGLYLNEACRAAEEGIPVLEIDKMMVQFGMPMGPFELMDEVGLDIAEKVGHHLAQSLPHFPKSSSLLTTVRHDGRTGKKGGKGFYIHGPKGKVLDEKAVRAALEEASNGRGFTMTTGEYDQLVDRMVLGMVNEASRCLEEGVVTSPRDVDVGMVLGTGFAPFRGGLLAYADVRGARKIADQLRQLAEKYGAHFRPTRLLEELAEQDASFAQWTEIRSEETHPPQLAMPGV